MDVTALEPKSVADAVVDAVLDGRFYVLPNADWSHAIGERAARIMAGGPVSPPPLVPG